MDNNNVDNNKSSDNKEATITLRSGGEGSIADFGLSPVPNASLQKGEKVRIVRF